MSGVRERAERARLAQVLGVAGEEVAFLDLAADDLKALREAVVDHLYDLRGERLSRVAAAARITPAPVAASLAEAAVGPVMAGLMASAVEPRKLLDIATRLRPAFVAQVCPHLDPRRVPEVVRRMPTGRVVAIARELAARGDHLTMAQFVEHLPDDAIVAVVAELDDVDVIRAAPLVDVPSRVDAIAAALDDERLAGLVRAAADPAVTADALGLLAAVGPEQLRRIGTVALAADPTVVDGLVAQAAAHDLWDGLLPLVPALDPDDRARLAARPALHEPEVLAGVTHAAIATDRWLDLLPLASLLPAAAQDRLADVVAGLDANVRHRLRTAAEEHDVIDALGPVAAALGP